MRRHRPAKKQVASSAAAEDSDDDKPIGQLKGAAKRKRASTFPAGGAKNGKAKPNAKKAPPKKYVGADWGLCVVDWDVRLIGRSACTDHTPICPP